MDESPSTFLENADRSIRTGILMLLGGAAVASVWLYIMLYSVPSIDKLGIAQFIGLGAFFLLLKGIVTYQQAMQVYDSTDKEIVREYREWKIHNFPSPIPGMDNYRRNRNDRQQESAQPIHSAAMGTKDHVLNFRKSELIIIPFGFSIIPIVLIFLFLASQYLLMAGWIVTIVFVFYIIREDTYCFPKSIDFSIGGFTVNPSFFCSGLPKKTTVNYYDISAIKQTYLNNQLDDIEILFKRKGSKPVVLRLICPLSEEVLNRYRKYQR